MTVSGIFVRAAVLGGLLMATMAGGAAFAQSTGNSQQDRMKACNAQAGAESLSGDKRKTFMSACLSGKTPAPGLTAQQQKMKTCNAQASTQKLTGDARKTFMSSCLKG